MPALGNHLQHSQYQALNFVAHKVATPGPTSPAPVAGQLYYNTTDNTLYWHDGTQWVAAKGGSPTGSAGGDLSGTYPNPQIAAGVITDADVNSANKDGVAGTASMRTLGLGAQQAMAGNTRLDQVTAPTASVSLAGQRIVSMGTPSSGTDGANKDYVDNTSQGLDAKASVKAATTANIAAIAGGAPNTLDGVTLATNDRVLVKDQTTQGANGIYVVTTLGSGANGAWTRSTDMDNWTEVPSAYVWVEQGTTNADTGWVCTADAGGTLNTTAITWVQFSGAAQITAGGGLTKTGSTLDVGAGAGITVNADSVQVANNGITNAMLADGAVNLATADVTGTLPLTSGGTGQTTAKAARESGLLSAGYYSSATHSAGTTISITQGTHGLRGSQGLMVQVQEVSTGLVVLPDVVVANTGDVTVTFGASVAANAYRVTILG